MKLTSASRFPRAQDRYLAERVVTPPPGVRVREWTLRDDNAQHYHARVPVSESPLYVRLHWRPDARGPVQEVGLYRLHLGALLAEEYIRPERTEGSSGEVRVRFYRRGNGTVYLQTRRDAPALPVGEVRRVGSDAPAS